MVSYLFRYESLLQNAKAILLQNATKVFCKMNQIFYYKMQQFFEKMRRSLQNASVRCIRQAKIFQGLCPGQPSQPKTFHVHFLQPLVGHSDKNQLVLPIQYQFELQRNWFCLVSALVLLCQYSFFFIFLFLGIVSVIVSSFSSKGMHKEFPGFQYPLL